MKIQLYYYIKNVFMYKLFLLKNYLLKINEKKQNSFSSFDI